MDLAPIRLAIRYMMPASWLGLSALGLLSTRIPRGRSLAIHAIAFFGSAFVTRLAVEEHESRWQVTCFLFGALVIEAIRARRPGEKFSFAFWIAAAAASVVGAAAARPIAHRYGVSTW